MSDIIEVIAYVAAIVLAGGAVIVFIATRVRVLVRLVASTYAGEIGGVVPHVTRRAIARRLVPRVRERVIGAGNALVQAEIDALSELDPTVDLAAPIPWDAERVPHLADAYDKVARRLQRSAVLRLRSNDLIVSESAIALSAARALRLDADFRPSAVFGAGTASASASALRELLHSTGTRLLVEPPVGTASGSFASVRATLVDRDFGMPTLPFSDFASRSHDPSDWAPASPELAAALDDHARTLAAERAARGADYNGSLARLIGWRCEQSRSSGQQRLHVLLERTNFLSLIASNGDLPSASSELRARLIDGSLRTNAHAPRSSITANALAVHLAIISADRKLVLTQRSDSVEWAPEQLNTAVNGVAELGHRGTLRPGDTDPDGFPDLARAALREADEEIGTHLRVEREALVVRALALNDRSDQITPYVVFEARSPATLDEIAAGHFARVSRHEGAFEVGGYLIGIPLDPDVIRQTVSWLRHRWDVNAISASGLATTLLTFARVVSAEPCSRHGAAKRPRACRSRWSAARSDEAARPVARLPASALPCARRYPRQWRAGAKSTLGSCGSAGVCAALPTTVACR